MDSAVLCYREHRPVVGSRLQSGPGAVVIGRAHIAESVELGRLAVLRADGERITIGPRSWLGDRSTVHIADDDRGSVVGTEVAVGHYALVHGCTLEDGVVVGDAAVVMDHSVVGAGAVIAAGALVPPGKTLAGGWLYAGSPAPASPGLGPWRGGVTGGGRAAVRPVAGDGDRRRPAPAARRHSVPSVRRQRTAARGGTGRRRS